MNKRTLVASTLAFLMISLIAAAPGLAAEKADRAAKNHSDEWLISFHTFLTEHRDLNGDQVELVWQAIDAGTSAAFAQDSSQREQAALDEVVNRATKLLTPNQLGSLFSSMGKTQFFLVEQGILRAPYCNCSSLGSACNNHPGTCKVGCISWEKDDQIGQNNISIGAAYVGICSD